jgi:hypothetical protein
MKKTAFIMIAAAAIFVQSCNQGAGTQDAGNATGNIAAKLAGKWYEEENDLTLTLNPDGTYNEVFFGKESERGVYKLTGDSVYFDIDDDGAIGIYKKIFSIDDKQMVMGNESWKSVYIRK